MSDEKQDLDLINMVQNARMQHDNDAVPSKVPGVYWIEAKRQQGDYPALTPRTGEFRIATHVDDVDAQWAKIKAATEAGELGYKSKVSTRPAHGQPGATGRMICVRTYDAADRADLERIHARLQELGFDQMTYQRDNDQGDEN